MLNAGNENSLGFGGCLGMVPVEGVRGLVILDEGPGCACWSAGTTLDVVFVVLVVTFVVEIFGGPIRGVCGGRDIFTCTNSTFCRRYKYNK